MRLFNKFLIVGIALCPVLAAADPATEPATGPATQSSAQVTPQAREVLHRVRDAYAKLTSLELAGTISLQLDVAGQQQSHSAAFAASYVAPDRFRAEIPDDVLVGSTGSRIYAYHVTDNSYVNKDRPMGKISLDDMPQAVSTALRTQYPSLALALSPDAETSLTRRPQSVERAADVKIGSAVCPCLLLHYPKTEVRAAFDPATYLLRQWTVDRTAELNDQRGTSDVKSALVVFDYSVSTPGAALDAKQFAWSVPQGARDLETAAAEMMAADVESLAGKAAPDFSLDDLDGKAVKLSEQAGSVVVLDFWASWCPPCRESLPHLEKVYEDNKDRGLKVFIINVREAPADVKRFITQMKLTMPVLLDTSQTSVAEKFGVSGIPQTVVISKSGIVTKVMVGFGPDTEQMVRSAVEAAMKADK